MNQIFKILERLRFPAAPVRAAPAPAALLATLLVILLAAFATLPASAAFQREEKAKLALQADRSVYQPGAALRLTALVAIDPGWHVNSHTPTFEYLIPTQLELDLPAGWGRPEVEYPPAKMKRFTFAEVPLSVYDGDVVIQARLKLPAAARGAFPIHARLQYQACNESQCLPPVTSLSQLTVTVAGSAGVAGAAPTGGAAAPPAAPAPLPGHTPTLLGGIGPARPAASTPAAVRPPPPPPPANLAAMLLVALLGGLILNAMPCVLPILSLKVFGLVRSGAKSRREVVRASLATTAGILVSFWALAALAVAASAAGSAVGWGIQFQRPGFVAFLAVVVTLFCLNLWGLFEIHLPAGLAPALPGGGTGGGAAPRESLAGHFGSGLFATLMATPCSAPFLGTAVGFALSQPAVTVFAIFTAVGIGLALPYLALASAPATARLLPRPGAWMETLRGTMGFLLAASAIWLLYVLAAQVSPERLALFEIGLLLIALCTWLRHRAVLRAAERPRIAADRTAAQTAVPPPVPPPARAAVAAMAATAAVAAAAIAAVAIAATGAGVAGGSAAGAATQAGGPIAWVAFDRTRAESLAAAGQLVFVDVTADWCFTCKVNERLILNTPEVATAFANRHVLPMRADWTNRNDEITRFLADHGRYGIPFYLLYRPGREPYVFSELPSKSSLLTVLEAAAAPAKEARKL
jgi:thiol:disulfide interchange protein